MGGAHATPAVPQGEGGTAEMLAPPLIPLQPQRITLGEITPGAANGARAATPQTGLIKWRLVGWKINDHEDLAEKDELRRLIANGINCNQEGIACGIQMDDIVLVRLSPIGAGLPRSLHLVC